MLTFISDKKERLDKFLASKISSVSRGKIQKAIKDGLVLVNGKKVIEPDFQVSESDQVQLPEFKKDELTAYSLELKIVYENDDLAVIDKPAGLVVHPGAGNTEGTLANILISKYPNIRSVGDPHRPGIIHRLDEDTSGLILVAKNQQTLEYFKRQFQERKVEKEYLALVEGHPPHVHGIINAPLEKVPLKQKMRVGSGKEAVTEYWVKGINGEKRSNKDNGEALHFSLLRIKLHTGRTHQIRAHLAHIGHPIVGDAVYGHKSELIDRQFLHASRLKFQLQDGTWLEVESELPEDLKKVLEKLEINSDSNMAN
ncbi:MAG: hypothetical protein A3H72_00330 [Candidatus Doudnabacteria bacterium RIFCSPLOWO2_02_FULL_48_8]|uniref:Pseudouridine synthase n=1 Tax=Candidatus Doudnabacteria bacterium RIFCSPHIGHO2_01_FULL_46_24 TaxID=1817825 RepID=A0A1F5NW48_9BACT|nr:MAG: hypothetical protein A2720_03590 [Candidatus Doudnabacteria bacterium RIFCSPHIGHO2_01_FULL_46_24]OGE95312.1 MAG: hypothetical protein A3H72_00330 [Candidatus Doudnabacteria bacterium RIFCSPLOWO2_02_FULL_48_8]OGE95616.1 MAG: hypothetical protein A3E98_01295 [Candidatus Doudnabacteria bacterium RIFCSPHIGHO2_12_FULL_48_11]